MKMLLTKENTVVGFVGIGVMGKSMVENLLQAGYRVNVHTRTKSKAEVLLSSGAVWKDTVAELASEANVIITMVGYPKDVEEIYLGQDGLIDNANSGTYLIDMTTSTPSLAEMIFEKAWSNDIFALDAPVSGGDVGARNATLAIMVGGNEKDFQTVFPIFKTIGENIVYQGKEGAGQHTKMCNQITIASNMVGVCEAMMYAEKAGLDPKTVLKSIESGAAGSWSLSNLAPRMLDGDFEPGFYVKHFIKDMAIALEAAKEMNLQTPGLELAKTLYDKLASQGEGNSGTQALYRLFG
jgi:3-hydroxyisobutyrate dehydrogenase